jgi:hypothetical protein
MKDEDKALSKSLEWIARDLQDILIYRSDDQTIEKMKEIKKNDKDFEAQLNWIEEYSMSKNKQRDNIENVLTKQQKENYSSEKKPSKILESPNLTARSLKSTNTSLLNFSEDCIVLIENPNFDIFKLEKEVGQENTLSTISCYIFITMGLYSIVNYNNFETFLQAITKGYNRTSAYHNVIDEYNK